MAHPTTAWFTPTVLEGEVVRLEPMSVDHLGGLIAAGRDPRIWTWMPTDGSSPDGMRELVDAALAARDARTQIPFVTIARATGRVVGSSRYLAPAPADLRVEIGWTWLDPAVQRTAVNTEAKLLMLAHAFDHWRVHRVSLMTDARNERSRRAILRLGARFDGVLRAQRPGSDGTIRDTAAFSILDHEWPMVKQQLHSRLNS